MTVVAIRRLLNGVLVVALGITVWRASDLLGTRDPPPRTGPLPRLQLGDPFRHGESLRGPGEAEPRVVLAIRSTCPACNASDAFYRSLAERLETSPGRKLSVVSPDPASVIRQWLDDRSIRVDEVVSDADLYALGFSVTPTLLLLDEAGLVTDMMAGRLTGDEEEQVFERVSGHGAALNNVTYAAVIDETELLRLQGEQSVFIIDVRDRRSYALGHRENAVNIPRDELVQRAPVEVPLDRQVAVECPGASYALFEIAAEILIDLGISRVSMVAGTTGR